MEGAGQGLLVRPRRGSSLATVLAGVLTLFVTLLAVPAAAAPQGGGRAGGSTTGGAVVTDGVASGASVNGATATKTLVLYDTSGSWGYLGELYAIEAANLASHFGAWTAEPVQRYTSGQMSEFTAVVYLGSSYNEPIPASFLSDVLTGQTPVIWTYYNIWQLAAAANATASSFQTRYGWTPGYLDSRTFTSVQYQGETLTRSADNGSYSLEDVTPTAAATVLASAYPSDGSAATPYAVQSGNLTYVADNPFPYASEQDRVLVFEDLLFNVLDRSAPTQHRALVRLEDVDPTSNPQQLEQVANWLYSQHIPFGFNVIPEYTDPNGYYNNGVPQTVTIKKGSAYVKALLYLEAHGGTLVDEGYTHQYSDVPNPFTAVTGDDFEFYRVTQNSNETLNYQGPVSEDSSSWANGRVQTAISLIQKAGIGTPAIFTVPHYAASAPDYAVFNSAFAERWDRGLYFTGLLTGAPINYSQNVGQFFPYTVRDVYGTKVLPENCGDISPTPWEIFPARTPADIINCAKANLVVRDGVAAFTFHPYLDLSYLQQTVAGLQSEGYTFVSPSSL